MTRKELAKGSPLSWQETKQKASHVRKHGLKQFINIYNKTKDTRSPALKWGDEIEYMIIALDQSAKTAHVSLRSNEILESLQREEIENPETARFLWRPEYGAYMVEGTPGKPYSGVLKDLLTVEPCMIQRRKEIQKYLKSNEIAVTLTSYPRLACPFFSEPPLPQESSSSKSTFFPDMAINHMYPRYRAITFNTRERRGDDYHIRIPVMKDQLTRNSITEVFEFEEEEVEETLTESIPNFVCYDSVDGMGYCCLQVTFQAFNMDEARTLYDQLAPICPILLALTAASPVHRGFLTGTDCRWNIISQCVDCRTKEERGLEPLSRDRFIIPKSRYDSISAYISNEGSRYNDVPVVLNDHYLLELLEAGVEEPIARHIAHLFVRDPLVLFSEKVDQEDEKEIDHFDNIQSTNWQTVRLKLPLPDTDVGWRVEFRPCEVQITDFENAAFVCFIALLTRIILSYKLNFLIPISKVDENMKRSQEKDAIKNCKFYFNSNPFDSDSDEVTEMTINEIINGKDGYFSGLIPLVESFLNATEIEAETHQRLHDYLRLISGRASGELQTAASWIRSFVRSHPSYKLLMLFRFDSQVTEEITYDLITAINQLEQGTRKEPLLYGY
ncbi:glutamate--cysteine ligase catalytic subunit-like isoform X1 [Artemia franciscana]|uniref:glutamate--cysteine ligase catalytic subunit-like isoform X1 n=1 Tax=Artemia franciscana TaxID=6661 RepID=UPI0032DAD9D4